MPKTSGNDRCSSRTCTSVAGVKAHNICDVFLEFLLLQFLQFTSQASQKVQSLVVGKETGTQAPPSLFEGIGATRSSMGAGVVVEVAWECGRRGPSGEPCSASPKKADTIGRGGRKRCEMVRPRFPFCPRAPPREDFSTANTNGPENRGALRANEMSRLSSAIWHRAGTEISRVCRK